MRLQQATADANVVEMTVVAAFFGLSSYLHSAAITKAAAVIHAVLISATDVDVNQSSLSSYFLAAADQEIQSSNQHMRVAFATL